MTKENAKIFSTTVNAQYTLYIILLKRAYFSQRWYWEFHNKSYWSFLFYFSQKVQKALMRFGTLETWKNISLLDNCVFSFSKYGARIMFFSNLEIPWREGEKKWNRHLCAISPSLFDELWVALRNLEKMKWLCQRCLMFRLRKTHTTSKL